MAFVVGRRARGVGEAEALDHLARCTLLNDLSARDLQLATPLGCPARSSTAPPPAVPRSSPPRRADPLDALEIELALNGDMQSASTADLMHSIPTLPSHLSRLMTLEPGDVVFTGTPAGISSPQLGRLETRLS